MKSAVKKWGNSAALRLPAAALAIAGIEVDSQVEIEAEKGRLIIRTVSVSEYALDDLLAGCSPGKIALNSEDREWLDSDVQGEELW